MEGSGGLRYLFRFFCFLYFIALLTLVGPFYFGIPFLGMLACDHGNWPSQVLDWYGEVETEGGTGKRDRDGL